MSQPLANIVVHLVFSTKGRRQLLLDEERGQLHAYATGILKNRYSPLAPKFEALVKPNDWAKSGREQTRDASSASPTKQIQQKLWMDLIKGLAKNAPQIRSQKPRPQHWLTNSIGRLGFGLNITANTRDERLGVELWIPGAEAEQHFVNLSAQKKDIEGKLGFDLDWQELPDAKACRIAAC